MIEQSTIETIKLLITGISLVFVVLGAYYKILGHIESLRKDMKQLQRDMSSEYENFTQSFRLHEEKDLRMSAEYTNQIAARYVAKDDFNSKFDRLERKLDQLISRLIPGNISDTI